MNEDPDPTAGLSAALDALPGVVDALLARHVPDDRGRCRGCTEPGTGRPAARWPCGLHYFAAAAAAARARRGDRDPTGATR